MQDVKIKLELSNKDLLLIAMVVETGVIKQIITSNSEEPEKLKEHLSKAETVLNVYREFLKDTSQIDGSIDGKEPTLTNQVKGKNGLIYDRSQLVHSDGIVSLLDGKKYRSMKRHLTTNGLSEKEYKELYGLPEKFPLVCSDYSSKRSGLAKESKLGHHKKG